MARKLSTLFIIISFLSTFVIIGCTNNEMKEKVTEFMSHPVHIPYEKFDKRFCSMFSDSTESQKAIKVVYYVDSMSCTPCEINKMALIDAKKRDLFPNVEFVYIINIHPSNVDKAYSALCNARIVSPVYLDTLNAFLSVNPNFPDEKMFHSFVLNDKDSVLMAGFPFSTAQMETLFEDIVNKNK